MDRTYLLREILKIEPEEGRPLALLLGHAFFVGVAIVAFYSVSSALFLTAFPSNMLPYVYLAAAGVSTLTGGIYSRFEKRLPIGTVLMGTLVFLFLSVVVFRVGLLWMDAQWPAFGMMVWHTVLYALLNVEFWGLATRLFDVQQGKRLFGLLGAGEMVASVIGGLLTPLLVQLVGTPNLLLVSGVGLVLCMVTLKATVRRFGDRISASGVPQRKVTEDGYSGLLKNRYVILIFMLYLVSITVFFFLDFIFLDQSRRQFESQDELARFFGVFYGVAQGLSLLLLTFVTGRFVTRFGIRAGLRVRPVVLMGCVLGMGVVGMEMGFESLFFGLVVVTKLLDLVLYRSFNRPSFLILYQPLQPERKFSVQVTVESMVGPIAGGIAGAVLLLISWFGATGLVYLNGLILAIIVCWLAVGIPVYRAYRNALSDALVRRRLGGGTLSYGPSVVEILKARLESPHAGDVIYALDLLEKSEGSDYQALLPGLMIHPVAGVRQDVFDRIGRLQPAGLLSVVQHRVEKEQSPGVLAAALKALCALGEADVLDTVSPYLDHEDQEVRLGAMVGLLRNGGIDGVLLVGRYLLALENSPNAKERTFVAQALGEVGIQNFYRPLLKLLGDTDSGVRQAALGAAGAIQNPRLWPLVLESLASYPFHTAAGTALVAAGPVALPALRTAFGREGVSSEFQVRIAAVCGRIREPASVAFLVEQMGASDRSVRTQVLRALHLNEFRSEGVSIVDVRRLIREEVADIAWMLAALADVGEQKAVQLLRSALLRALEQGRERIFLLLSFLYDSTTVMRVKENLRHESSQQRAYALEVLHTTVSRDLEMILLPICESSDWTVGLAQLQPHFPQKRLLREERLRAILSGQELWMPPWVRMCSVRAISEMGDPGGLVNLALQDKSTLVRETAALALFRVDPEAFAKAAPTLRDDRSMIRAVEKIERWQEGGRTMLLTVEKVMILRSIRIFEGIPEDVLANLAEHITEVEIPAGEHVYEKGGMGRTMYVVVEGKLRVHDGAGTTFVYLGERDLFGELTTLDPEPHAATVSAEEDASLLGLDRDVLYELMSDHPEVLRGIIKVLIQRLRGKRQD